jgi:hypothetical protein
VCFISSHLHSIKLQMLLCTHSCYQRSLDTSSALDPSLLPGPFFAPHRRK